MVCIFLLSLFFTPLTKNSGPSLSFLEWTQSTSITNNCILLLTILKCRSFQVFVVMFGLKSYKILFFFFLIVAFDNTGDATCRWRITGIQKQMLWEAPPSNKRVEIMGITQITFETDQFRICKMVDLLRLPFCVKI